jgi:hypothetical protein
VPSCDACEAGQRHWREILVSQFSMLKCGQAAQYCETVPGTAEAAQYCVVKLLKLIAPANIFKRGTIQFPGLNNSESSRAFHQHKRSLCQ